LHSLLVVTPMSVLIEVHDGKLFEAGPGLEDMVQMSIEDAEEKLKADTATYMGFMVYDSCAGFVRFAKKGTSMLTAPGVGSVHVAYVELEPQDESDLATIEFPDEDSHELMRPGRGFGYLDGCEPPASLWMEMSPADMAQGALGDCWLISGLACLAEFPDTISAVFKQSELTPDGKYDITLYDYTTKQYKTLQVDDRLPVKGVAGFHESALAKSTVDNEIWPCLLEKAFAVLFNTFDLNGGLASTVFACMLGIGSADIDFYYRDDDPDSWQCYQPGLDELHPSGSTTKVITQTGVKWPDGSEGKAVKDAAYIGKVLTDFDARNYVVCAGSNSGSDTTMVGGIAQGHAYSVLKCVSVSGFTLLQLRNPWGFGEWDGDWSDESSLWEQNPEVAAELNPEVADDGTFWMALEDFADQYAMICVAKKDCGKKKAVGYTNVVEHQNAIEQYAEPSDVTPVEITKLKPAQRRKEKKPNSMMGMCGKDCSVM